MERAQFLLATASALAAAGFPATGAAQLPSRPPIADYPLAIADLVSANRILAHENIVDGFGHVSVRDPRDPANYLLARSMAPALVTADDIMTYDVATSTPVDPRGRASYAERFIHGGIYRARPDVKAVVHSHTPSVIPFGAVGTVPLRPIYHMGAFLSTGVPVFEIDDAGGTATDMLVETQALGDALARTLGSANVVLMRGHGMAVAGASIPEAVFRAYYTAQDAQLEAEALRLGTPRFLGAQEAQHATQIQANLVPRTWDLWKRAISAP